MTKSLFLVLVSLLSFCQAGTLFGAIGPEIGLTTIDPRTAFSLPFGKNETTEIEGQQLSSLDPKNNLIYFVAFDTSNSMVALLGIDLKTAKQVYNVPLPFKNGVFVGVGQAVEVNTNTGDVFVCGRDPTMGNKHHVISVNPKTGAKESLAVIGDIDVLGGISGFDALNNVLWLEFGINGGNQIDLFRYNVANKTYSMVPNNLNMETMDFDPTTGLMVGVGLQVLSPTNFFRVFLTLDSKNNKFTVAGKIPGYFIIRSSEGALDYKNRMYYSILQLAGKSSNPFELVQYQMTTGTVGFHPKIGDASCSLCPWSIHFLV